MNSTMEYIGIAGLLICLVAIGCVYGYAWGFIHGKKDKEKQHDKH